MGAIHLDHPGDFHWFHGYGPRKVIGPCPHKGCPHNATSVVAWGPDTARYELVDCDVGDGCAGNCRAWVNSYGAVITSWLYVADPAERN
jgi:hypothetical protein